MYLHTTFTYYITHIYIKLKLLWAGKKEKKNGIIHKSWIYWHDGGILKGTSDEIFLIDLVGQEELKKRWTATILDPHNMIQRHWSRTLSLLHDGFYFSWETFVFLIIPSTAVAKKGGFGNRRKWLHSRNPIKVSPNQWNI